MVRIAAMGDNVVDCYVSTGQMYPGGNCLNVSVFAARFQAEAAYVGRIGTDPAGRAIVKALTEEGVDTGHLRILNGATGWCLIGHRGGDRVFVDYDLGVSMFAPSVEELDFVGTFDAVHIGQSSGLDPFLPDVARRTRLSYDFSTKHEAGRIRDIAPACLLASASGGGLDRHEAIALLQAIVSAGAKWALVTRGEHGALLGDGKDLFEADARVVSLTDTLGAGDTTIARVLCGLLANEPPQALLDAAMGEAARTCSYYGAIGHGVPIDLGAASGRLTAGAARQLS